MTPEVIQSFDAFSALKEVLSYAILNSIVVFGILQTVAKFIGEEKIKALYIGTIVTYIAGIVMGFMIQQDLKMWESVSYGLFIGSVSVAVYKSATQSLLQVIPKLFNKFLT